MKIEIKGKVTVVGEPVQKSEKFTVQTVVLSKYWLDDNGDSHVKIYPFQVVGDAIEKLNMKNKKDKVVVATGYLNGVETEKGEYFVNLRLQSVAVVDKAEDAATVQNNPEPVASDDTPF